MFTSVFSQCNSPNIQVNLLNHHHYLGERNKVHKSQNNFVCFGTNCVQSLNKNNYLKYPMPVIYVIDDEPLILEVVQLFLQSQGHTVHSFNSPNDVNIQQMVSECELLICDVQLRQRKDGLEYCTEWIANGLQSPVLIISGFMQNPSSFQQQWSFLKKPFNRRQLNAEVERLLHKPTAF